MPVASVVATDKAVPIVRIVPVVKLLHRLSADIAARRLTFFILVVYFVAHRRQRELRSA